MRAFYALFVARNKEFMRDRATLAWLRRLARHLVDNPSDAEDVAQEAWLAAAHAGGQPSRGWMRVVARR